MHVAPLRLLDLLRARDGAGRTPASIIGEAAERIARVDPHLQAFVHLASPDALRRDAAARGLLAGIPIGVKDIFDTADMPTAYGSPIYDGHRPAADAALVAMARQAGAAVMGKTATTEFAFMQPAATANPHHLAHTPGGSSAGSAAAVAAGMVAGAFGSQTAGSIIRPASFCGVCGYKPSFRLLPTIGMKPFAWTLDTAGLFAPTAADAGALASLISGRDLFVDETLSLADLRIGLYRSAIDDRLSPSMAEAFEALGGRLRAAGASVEDVAEPDGLARAREAQSRIQIYEGAIALLHERRTKPDQLSTGLADALAATDSLRPEAYDEDRRIARAARRASAALFERCDMLLAPSALGSAPLRETTGDPAMNRLWTLLGLPCVNAAGLVDRTGLPLGISVVARFGQDRLALSATAAIEALIRT